MGRQSRREQRRWQRELEEQLRNLPTYEGDTGDGGPVDPLDRRLPRAPRPARSRGRAATRRTTGGGVGAERRRTFLTVGVTVAVVVAVLASGLTPLPAMVRGILGLGDRGDSTTYAFISTDPFTGEPHRWSSCDPIRYVVNPDRAPAGWEGVLDDALAAVSEASGLEFESAGSTDEGPGSDRYSFGNRPKPVLIGWFTPEQEPELAGTIAGIAGPQSRSEVFETGTVFLDAGAFAEMAGSGERRLELAVLTHELGHLVGLAHVDDDRQLMYPETTYQTSFGEGDLEGLRILGEGPCR